MVFSLRLSKEEREIFDAYAEINSISLSEAFKTALMEKIEDEYDAVLSDKLIDKYIKDGSKSRPIQEFWDELGL